MDNSERIRSLRKILDSPDTIFFFLIIVLICFLVFGVTRQVSEPFTELYFDSFRALPDTTAGPLSFNYIIRNEESLDQSYNVKVTADYFVNSTYEKTVLLGQDSVFVSRGKRVDIPASVNITTPFEKVRINVSIPQKSQKIHFWVKHVLEEVDYDGFGNGFLDCLPDYKTYPYFDELTFSVRGIYAQGWPELTLFVNGKKTTRFIVRTATTENVTFKLPENSNEFVIDLVYENDFRNVTILGVRNETINVTTLALINVTRNITEIVNENGVFVAKNVTVNESIFTNFTNEETFLVNMTTAEDRNVFVEGVYLGSFKFQKPEFLIDQGQGLGSFDCRGVRNGSSAMFSPSSFRFRFVRVPK